jgi:predicted ATPase
MLFHAGAVAAAARQSAQATAFGEELGAWSARHGLSLWAALAPGITGMGLLEGGDAAGALGAFSRWLVLTEATGARVLGTLMRAGMAEAMAATGDAGALAMAAAAEAYSTRTGALYGLAEAQRRQGVVLRPDNEAGAEAAFRRAIATARDQNAKLWELRAACDLTRLLGAQGRGTEARTLLAPLYGWFTEGFETPDLVDARALLGSL